MDSRQNETDASDTRAQIPQSLRQEIRSAYIHIPFCRHHCGYCSFSVAAGRDYLVPRYLVALAREIAALPERTELDTLYLGGGTPSRLNPEQLQQLRGAIAQRMELSPQAEVTLEANPADVTAEWIRAAIDFGSTRISLGAQSFRPEKLRLLERDHEAATIRTAVEQLKSSGLTVSLDLIFATPGETCSQWEADLQAALALPLDHLSTYELTYEKGTRFWNSLRAGRFEEQDEDQRSELYRLTLEQLASANWEHYEVSSFARGGSRCRHNLVYWSGLPYLAFGAGASRFVGGVRSTNHSSTLRYIRLVETGASPAGEPSELTPRDLARELLAIGLRQIQGIREATFRSRSGMSFEEAAGSEIAELLSWGLLERQTAAEEPQLRLTPRGVFLYDAVAAKIAAV